MFGNKGSFYMHRNRNITLVGSVEEVTQKQLCVKVYYSSGAIEFLDIGTYCALISKYYIYIGSVE